MRYLTKLAVLYKAVVPLPDQLGVMTLVRLLIQIAVSDRWVGFCLVGGGVIKELHKRF